MKVLHNLPYEKVGNQEPVCIANKVPFEIPDSWEWVRLGNIGVWRSGSTPNRTKAEYYGGNIPWLKTGDLTDGLINHIPETITELALKETSVKLNPIGSVLIAMYGATIGKLGILQIPATTNQACCACLPFTGIYNKFLFYYLMSQKAAFVKKGEGGAQPNISKEKIVSSLMPLPPLDEQKRIVKKLQLLSPYVDKYNTLERTILKLDKNFPNQLKKSILQVAIQGKLVTQNPNDEPSHTLLKRIYEEKKKELKREKISKHESIIFRRDNSYYEKLDGVDRCIDDEIPFDIPDSWEWVRLGKISTYAESKKKINVLNVDSDLWQLDLEDIERGGKILRFKTVKEGKGVGDKTFFSKGDILYSKLRPYLLKILIAPADGICTPEIVPFQLYAGIIPEYIVAFLKSPYVDSVINSVTYGIKMPRVGTQTMVSLLVPVPPLEEQKRIVEYINKILPLISKL